MARTPRSEEHTSELQSPLNISYAVFCLKKKNKTRCLAMPSPPSSPPAHRTVRLVLCSCFFFNDTATTEISTLSDTLSLHDALPISVPRDDAPRLRVVDRLGD